MSDHHELVREAGAIAARTTPGALGTAGTAVAAIDGQVLVSLIVGGLTIVFLLVQIGYLLWKWQREAAT